MPKKRRMTILLYSSHKKKNHDNINVLGLSGFWALGFWGLGHQGFGLQALGFRVQGSSLWALGFRVQGFELAFRVQGQG